jgi:hypothetical protein
MQFYAQKNKKLGSQHEMLFTLKTIKGAIKRLQRYYGNTDVELYTYTNVYDDTTYKLVYKA